MTSMKKPAPVEGPAQAQVSATTYRHSTPSSDLAPLMAPVAKELLGEPNKELSRKEEMRFGTHGSLAVDLEGGRWFDHEQQRGGGVLDLIARETGRTDRRLQLAWLEEHGFRERQEPQTKPVKPVEVTRYRYNDAKGRPRFYVVRYEPKTFRQGHTDDRGRFVLGVKGIETRIPYHLDKLASQPEADVFLVEGEKDVHRLEALGLVATCNAGGAGKWTDEHSRHLAGRRVVILPDNDAPGIDHARKAKASLEEAGAEVVTVMLPGLPDKGDVSDWLDAGGTQQELEELVAQGGQELPESEPEAELEVQEDSGSDNDKQSQADKIVAFVQAWNDLFHDENDVAYARSRATGEVRALASKSFRHWLTAEFYAQFEKAVKDQSLREARMTLEGLAMQEQRPVHVRVAGARGDYWLDLGVDGSSRCVRLKAGAWSLEDQSDLMFCRSDSAQPLPDPQRGGDVHLLWRIANVPPEARYLVVAWLVECLRPDTPFPVVELLGEHGSAKSTAQTAIRRLIDPNAADLRGVPKSSEDLFVTGGVNHIISIENVSHLAAPIQDAMCVVATGGGFAKRKLYTDSEETVITLKRPVILNGIAAAVTQQDLVSRTLTVEMPVIESAQAKDKLEAEFEANRASILGGLLDIAAKALEYLPDMELPPSERPRLVEFAYLGMAVAKAMGEKPETFIEQFKTARQDGLERTLDASPVASAIRDWAEIHPGEVRDQSAREWRITLESFKPQGTDAWPRSDKGHGDAMRRAAPALRQLGIECRCLGKIGGKVKWRIGQQKSLNRSPACPDVLPSTSPEQDIRTSRTSVREVSLNDADREVF
ncbi:toprim domain-containing protein [Halomonas sp.]|uniref:toprim domain-containing protein n=1 Tax=Halomonas sp. TaxID=1486246 RepID=UPI003D150F9D